MAFNVMDNKGKHLGVIVDNYMHMNYVLMVALTEEKLEEEKIDYPAIKSFLAGIYGSKTILGKVKEDKLDEILATEYEERFSYLGKVSYGEFLKCCLLYNIDSKGSKFLEKLTGFIPNVELIKGYVLYDIRKTKIQNNTVIIEEDIEYIYEEKMQGAHPLYGKIIDFPIISVDIIGFGGPGGLSAQNHLHNTRIKMVSGNAETNIEIPLFIPVKKGDNIQIHYEAKNIESVLYQGALYRYN
jgi:hypothetical protein